MTLINAIPATVNLEGIDHELHAGIYYSRVFQILNSGGTAIDCSVATGNSYAANPPKAKFVNDAGATTGPSGVTPGVVPCVWRAAGNAGQFDLIILNSLMRTVTATGGKWELVVKDSAGNVEKLIVGTWKMSAFGEVTTASDPV